MIHQTRREPSQGHLKKELQQRKINQDLNGVDERALVSKRGLYDRFLTRYVHVTNVSLTQSTSKTLTSTTTRNAYAKDFERH